jgi:hypothetical protein
MPRYIDSHRKEQEAREDRRKQERAYRDAVSYGVYRAGCNADKVDYEMVSQAMRDGVPAQHVAAAEAQRQKEAARVKRQAIEDAMVEDEETQTDED